jgi:uncharacterized protein (UPF0276 family)
MLDIPVRERQAVGVGTNLRPDMYEWVTGVHGQSVDFLELDPDTFQLTRSVEERLRALRQEFPFILHSTSLSICGDNPFDQTYLRRIARFVEVVGADVYSDHLSFTRAGDVNLDLYMCPVFTDQMLEWLAVRTGVVRSAVPTDFALENVGMLFEPPGSDYTETQFVAKVVDRTGVPLQLNLDSVAVSASTIVVDPEEYLLRFPLDDVVTIAVVPEQSMNPMLRRRYGRGINQLMLRMLESALRHSQCTRVMVQGRPGDSFGELLDVLEASKDLFQRTRNTQS